MKKKSIVICIIYSLFFIISYSCNKNTPVKKEEEPDKLIPLNGLLFKSGVFAMHKAAEVMKWEQNRGAEVAVIAVAPGRESWNNLQNTWFMDAQCIPVGYKGTLNIAMPMWPEDGKAEDAFKGNYNAEWEKFGRSVAAKYPDAYIRIGWEMNINDWYFKATPETAEQWKQAFIHAVNSLRKASSKFRIVFNPNAGPGQTGTEDATIFYPGDQYVDLIGIDAYDWWPGYTSEQNIAYHRDQKYGWNWWLDFAKKHNKKFCLPEWGIAAANPNSGGDNPMYINFVYSWLKQNKDWIEFECYFHETDNYLRSDLFTGYNPKATAEYKRWMPLLKKQ